MDTQNPSKKMRRESHKEVERRRRELINSGISELAKIVPNCSERNKGGILQCAVQYVQQLKEAECRNAERWTMDKVLADQAINELTAVLECLKSEADTLRNQVLNLGGEVPPRPQIPALNVPGYPQMAMHPSYHYFPAPQMQPTHWPNYPQMMMKDEIASAQED